MTDQLRIFLETAGITLPRPIIQQCAEFCHALLEENQKVNLVSRSITEKELLLKHLVDSIMGFFVLAPSSIQNVKNGIDIGSGGGIPGLILAILTPNVSWTLLDSTQKKMHACQNIALKLGLKNVVCITGRSETLAHAKTFRESFDLATVRAVAKLPVILEYCLPFVRLHGTVLCYKGTAALTEIELSDARTALQKLGGSSTPQVQYYMLPENTGERTMVVVQKIHNTLPQYPRAVGIPSHKPL